MKKAKATKQTSVAHATATSYQLTGSDIASMSFNDLDSFIKAGTNQIVLNRTEAKKIRETIAPAIVRAYELLSKNQGARTDLDPSLPTVEKWMEENKALGSPSTFYRILKKAKALPIHVDDFATTPDGNPAKITHIHETADKVDVQEMRPNGDGTSTESVAKTYKLDDLNFGPKPFYCAKTVNGWGLDVAASAIQKAVRDGDEGNGCYWIRELYFTDIKNLSPIKVWKKILILYGEEIGNADQSLAAYLESLERMAEKVKDGRHSELTFIVNAMLVLCRAKKSRAADNANVWFEQHPTYKPPVPEEIEHYTHGELPTPVIPLDSKIYDKHTARGRQMGRGLDHFLEEAAVLTNESDIAGFQAPAPEKPFLTEGGL